MGENLFWESPETSGASAVHEWMTSPPHRADILTREWREVGVAAVHFDAAPGTYGGRSVTIVTADSASDASTRPGRGYPVCSGACSSEEERRPSKPRVGGSNPSRRTSLP